MKVDELTICEVKELMKFVGSNGEQERHPYEIGKNYLVRTVTFYYTGRLVDVTKNELVLQDVAWVADTVIFSEFIADGKVKEVEIFKKGKNVIIPRGSIVDVIVWEHELFMARK